MFFPAFFFPYATYAKIFFNTSYTKKRFRDLHQNRKSYATYAKKKSELRLFPQSSYAFLFL